MGIETQIKTTRRALIARTLSNWRSKLDWRSAPVRLLARAVRVVSAAHRARVWDSCARVLLHARRPALALRLYRRATHLDGWNPRFWRRRAAAAVRAGLLEDAALSYRSLLRLDPRNLRAHARLAGIYHLMGASHAAVDVCRRGLQRLPGSVCLQRQLGYLLFTTDCLQEALSIFEKLAEVSPNHCDTHYFLGLALSRTGRTTEARRALQRALALRPDDPRIYYTLGLCCTPSAGELRPGGKLHAAEEGDSSSLLLKGLVAEREVEAGRQAERRFASRPGRPMRPRS